MSERAPPPHRTTPARNRTASNPPIQLLPAPITGPPIPMLAAIETVILELDSMHTALQALSAEMRDAAANHVDAVAWESYRGVHADVAATASQRDEMPLHTAMMDVISDAGTFGRPARATDVAAHASTDVDEHDNKFSNDNGHKKTGGV